jgi:heme-degrading monooxygenase HmoA
VTFEHADSKYVTKWAQDNEAGFAGLELFRTPRHSGEERRVATVLFWDAAGQFYVETFGSDVPLEVLKKVAAEADALVVR